MNIDKRFQLLNGDEVVSIHRTKAKALEAAVEFCQSDDVKLVTVRDTMAKPGAVNVWLADGSAWLTREPAPVEWCEDCDVTYRGKACPLCQSHATLRELENEERALRPFQVVSECWLSKFEDEINRLAAEGWRIEEYRPIDTRDNDDKAIVSWTALMRRRIYDRDAHLAKTEEVERHFRAWRALRDEHRRKQP